MDIKRNLVKPKLFGIFFFISACCWEQEANYKWDIVNNSSDTIFISQARYPLPDSLVVLPYETFTHTHGSLGRHKTFYCAINFPEGEITVAVSGGKILKKDLDKNENWVQSSGYSKCKGEHKCSFIIEQEDLE